MGFFVDYYTCSLNSIDEKIKEMSTTYILSSIVLYIVALFPHMFLIQCGWIKISLLCFVKFFYTKVITHFIIYLYDLLVTF